ncbi:hypothetical protein H4R34_003433 [Dimargaris verticillata]|uniref:PCI domain-containing protein n=1 Tax=Dimargaris verticillata TaxID=2761393 RepID=A0A9W8B0V4_9FUNG|nr:hypothetical protein H4R34_003433 [Dimargaris verticillata]
MEVYAHLTAQLQPYIDRLARCSADQVAGIVQEALEAPTIYVFGPLLALAKVQTLAEIPETRPTFALLHLFAKSTWDEYLAQENQLSALTTVQMFKLKQLSLLSLASSHKTIDYETIQTSLDIPNMSDLEALVIDAIYRGILQGQLDQRHRRLIIGFVMGREVTGTTDQLDSLKQTRTARLCDGLARGISTVSHWQQHQLQQQAAKATYTFNAVTQSTNLGAPRDAYLDYSEDQLAVHILADLAQVHL